MSSVAARPLWTRFLPWAVILGAAFTAANISGGLGLPGMHALSKPFTTCLVLLYAWQAPSDGTPRKRWILVGLTLSIFGDAALAWPPAFLVGLGLFLLAQLSYLQAFRIGARGARWPVLAMTVHAATVVWMMVLWSRAPTTHAVPMWVYLALIGTTSLTAERWWSAARGTRDEGRALMAAVGGLMFVLADLFWAVSVFSYWIPGTFVWVMGSYWVSQWCIATSLYPCTRAPRLGRQPARGREARGREETAPSTQGPRDTSAMPL